MNSGFRKLKKTINIVLITKLNIEKVLNKAAEEKKDFQKDSLFFNKGLYFPRQRNLLLGLFSL